MTISKLDSFIEKQLRAFSYEDSDIHYYEELYDSISNERLRKLFSLLHANLIGLFELMNEQLPTNEEENHFKADPSRDLIKNIDIIFQTKNNLNNTKLSFTIDNYYDKLFYKCNEFLKNSGGSTLPPHMKKIELYETKPIFISSDTITLNSITQKKYVQLQSIGTGSFAEVYKYKDEDYNKDFAIKRAKNSDKTDLDKKDLERFSREYEQMKKLSSPYVVEVYNYNSIKHEYVMEFIDCTLNKYISTNNADLTKEKRKSIVRQILRAFKYIHAKNMLHRDISPNNILIKKYENIEVVKISDFGLVKIPDSSLTKFSSEMKGCFNDPNLELDGFENYNMGHETYALTRIVYFVMTGKTNMSSIKEPNLKQFVATGLTPDKSKRFKNTDEILEALKTL